MKKIVSFTVAVGLMASIAASASAAEVTTGTATPTPAPGTAATEAPATVTTSTYAEFETVITPEDLKPATPQIIITKLAAFHFSMNSTAAPAGWLSAQTIDTTGVVMTDTWGNEWREIYTWLGKAWIKVPASAYVINP